MEFEKKNEDSFSNLSEIITDMHKVLCDDTDTPEKVFVQQLEEFSVRIDELCYTVNSTFREAKLTERTAKRMAEMNISNIRKYEALAKNALQNGRQCSSISSQAGRVHCAGRYFTTGVHNCCIFGLGYTDYPQEAIRGRDLLQYTSIE